MINKNVLIAAKYIVGLTWVLGLLEIAIDITAIPTLWLWLLVIVSLGLHFIQSIYFYFTYRAQIDNMAPHIMQIMLFGMAHVLTMKLDKTDAPQ
ncbi:MAG: hypothetical protein HRU20_20565 [Pseudomonadales bacterium]|nr:hypothetical protein [Pseudomonadales bacterium]